MYDTVHTLKQQLIKNPRALLVTGCSFVAGTEAGTENSFVELLGPLLGRVAVNLGFESSSNIGAINRLWLYQLPWAAMQDVMVLHLFTGMNRQHLWNPRWRPVTDCGAAQEFHPVFVSKDHGVPQLDRAWAEHVSDFTEAMGAVEAVVNLENLCKVRRTRPPLYFSAFSRDYDRRYMARVLHNNRHLLDLIPWSRVLKLEQHNNFFDFAVSRSGAPQGLPLNSYRQMRQQDDELARWIAPGLHPTALAHREFAQELYKILVKYQ